VSIALAPLRLCVIVLLLFGALVANFPNKHALANSQSR